MSLPADPPCLGMILKGYPRISETFISNEILLLEKLVADVLEICSEHPDVVTAKVTVDKPHALRFADSVSLTLDYRPEQAGSMRLLEKAS